MIPRKRINSKRLNRESRISEADPVACAKKAYNVAKTIGPRVGALLALLNVESKYKDILFGGVSITDNLGIQSTLTSLSQGLTAITRTGQSVKFTHLSFNAFIFLGAVSAVTYVRVLVIADRDPNGAAFAVGDFYAAAATGTDYTSAHRNVGNLKRFSVMHDQAIGLASSTLQVKRLDLEIPLDFHTLYNTGNVGNVTDIQSGGLFLIVQSNQTVNYPTLTATLRMSFVDN